MPDPILFQLPDPQDPKIFNTVWFTWGEDKDDAASNSAGHPVFDAILVANIMGPGLAKSTATHVVRRKKVDGSVVNTPRNLGALLDAFDKQDAGGLAGTPLAEMTVLDSGYIATLKAMGVHTVEALANVNEVQAPNLMGFRKYKMAAQALLDQREGQAPLNKLTAELDAANEKLAQQNTIIEDLAARLKAVESKTRKAA